MVTRPAPFVSKLSRWCRRAHIAKRSLRRLTRKRNLALRLRHNNPTGKSPKSLSSPAAKNIPLSPSGKSVIWIRPSHPMRGAGRDRHERAVGCGGRESLRKTNAGRRGRRSRVVPTPRRWRQVRENISRATVARKPGHRGEHEISRKPPRRESRIASAGPVCSCAFFRAFVHTRPRVQRASGFPCALLFSEGDNRRKARAQSRREIGNLRLQGERLLRGAIPARRHPLRNLSGQRASATPPYPVRPIVLNQPNGVLQLTSASRPPLNRLRQQWREKRPTFGAIATIPSIQTVQIMARCGLDWIIVDLEHGPIDLTSAHAMITATSGTSCVPLARIAANEPWLAKAPMDIGALGINFPMICSRGGRRKGRAQRALSAARRPALGPVPRAVPLGRFRWQTTWRPPTTT